jgi:hypothetical protein
MAAFDVCLIPYVLNDYTEKLSPIKLYEYLALGKPIVATGLPYLKREAESITIVRTPSEFVASVSTALHQPLSVAEQLRRRSVAEGYSWVRQVDQVEHDLRPVLEKT